MSVIFEECKIYRISRLDTLGLVLFFLCYLKGLSSALTNRNNKLCIDADVCSFNCLWEISIIIYQTLAETVVNEPFLVVIKFIHLLPVVNFLWLTLKTFGKSCFTGCGSLSQLWFCLWLNIKRNEFCCNFFMTFLWFIKWKICQILLSLFVIKTLKKTFYEVNLN